MASPPIVGPSGSWKILQNNMREAGMRSYGHNMALPQTYYWFYEIMALGITNSLILTGLNLVILTLALQVLPPGYQRIYC